MRLVRKIFLGCFLVGLSGLAWSSDDGTSVLKEMRFVLHAHTEVSGTKSRASELAIRGLDKGIDAVILADYLQQKVELGAYPFHRWLKLSYEKPSIDQFGARKYEKKILEIAHKYAPLLLLPGAEVTPAYYWSGNLFKDDLTVHNLQKNMLVFGLSSEDLRRVPTVGNGRSGADAYHSGREGEAAYQQVIDYVNEKGGFVVWSTPDENPATTFKKGPIHFKTATYVESLRKTLNYSGIAVFPEGMIQTGIPGGMWDKILIDYCEGRRSKPVWAFSELILHQILPIDVDSRINVAWVAEKTEQALFDAIRKGRFYILSRGKTTFLNLASFSISESSQPKAISGETLKTQSLGVHVVAEVTLQSKFESVVKVDLLRMGEVVKSVEGTGKILIDFDDDLTVVSEKRIYYRIQARAITGEDGILISNPIFVERV